MLAAVPLALLTASACATEQIYWADSPEGSFLSSVRERTVVLAAMSDEALLALGTLACEALRSGLTSEETVLTFVEAGMLESEAIEIVTWTMFGLPIDFSLC